MLIRIKKTGPGCAFQPGQVLKMNDNRARHLIENGYAVAVVDDANYEEALIEMQAANTVKAPLPAVTMQPPRHICGCGLVCESAASLEEHRRLC